MSSVTSLLYIFNCNDPTQTVNSARKLVEPVGRILDEKPGLPPSFLVATTKKKADIFAAANLRWLVCEETQVKLPASPRRLKIVKPPENT